MKRNGPVILQAQRDSGLSLEAFCRSKKASALELLCGAHTGALLMNLPIHWFWVIAAATQINCSQLNSARSCESKVLRHCPGKPDPHICARGHRTDRCLVRARTRGGLR
jgi:hypothetical protein